MTHHLQYQGPITEEARKLLNRIVELLDAEGYEASFGISLPIYTDLWIEGVEDDALCLE